MEVGIARREAVVVLGVWDRDLPDPAGPLGLAATPVVVLPDGSDETELVVAGIERAGNRARWAAFPAGEPALGLRSLEAVTAGAEVVLVQGGAGAELQLARLLGGRPLPVLALPDLEAIRRQLAGCDVDVHVAVPAPDDARRGEIRAILAPAALEETHHLVDVDPAPAFAAGGGSLEHASLASLAAGATGVLAGRLAATNRRWRAGLA